MQSSPHDHEQFTINFQVATEGQAQAEASLKKGSAEYMDLDTAKHTYMRR